MSFISEYGFYTDKNQATHVEGFDPAGKTHLTDEDLVKVKNYFEQKQKRLENAMAEVKAKKNEILNPVEGKLSKIMEEWKSPYFVMLGINAHLRECTVDFDRYMSSNTDARCSKEELRQELDKELMDLLILLEMKREQDGDEMYQARLNRFLEKYAEEQKKGLINYAGFQGIKSNIE